MDSPFPASLPADQDKIWTVTKTSIHLKLDCNGVEVLEVDFSESGCTQWDQDVEKIQFRNQDTASDGYRQRSLAVVHDLNEFSGTPHAP